MMNELYAVAHARSVEKIVGVYRPTPKNALVANLLPQFGFRKTGDTALESTYEIEVDKTDRPTSFVAVSLS